MYTESCRLYYWMGDSEASNILLIGVAKKLNLNVNVTKFFTPQGFGSKVLVELADNKNRFNRYKWQPFSIYKERFVLNGLYFFF